jgi:hypothetical protein
MSRAYYIDPLAAAWMAKHFGMIFVHHYAGWLPTPFLNDGRPGGAYLPEWFNRGLRDYPDHGKDTRGNQIKFYIHPDSMHLLEPQEGDVGIDAAQGSFHYNQKAWRPLHNAPQLPMRIIARGRINPSRSFPFGGGVIFHYPEFEK